MELFLLILNAIMGLILIALTLLLWHMLRVLQAAQVHALPPLLKQVTDTCEQQKRMLEALGFIEAQLTTDSGMSLRDAVNRVDEASKQAYEASEFLKVGVREDRHKAELDREQLQRLLTELFRISIKVEAALAGIARAEKVAVSVADDLAESHRRAEEVGAGDHGAAADAAARMTEKEKLKDEES